MIDRPRLRRARGEDAAGLPRIGRATRYVQALGLLVLLTAVGLMHAVVFAPGHAHASAPGHTHTSAPGHAHATGPAPGHAAIPGHAARHVHPSGPSHAPDGTRALSPSHTSSHTHRATTPPHDGAASSHDSISRPAREDAAHTGGQVSTAPGVLETGVLPSVVPAAEHAAVAHPDVAAPTPGHARSGADCDGCAAAHGGMHACVFVLVLLTLGLGLVLLARVGARDSGAGWRIQAGPFGDARPPPWTVFSLSELSILRI